MNTWVMIGAVAVAVVGVWAFVLPKAASGYEVKAMSAKEMTQAKAVIVDIRRPDEWAATGVIKGAKLITFTDQASFLAQLGPVPAGSPLVIICQSGRRSGAAAAALAGNLDGPIISYAGGMSAWIADKGQITKPKM